MIRRILFLPHIKVQSANALSSPFTIGFPAMTSWLGAVHALQRKLNDTDFEHVNFKSTAVISHDMELQTKIGQGDFVKSIVVPKKPLKNT